MEAVVAVVGFLGAGKTTVLRHLITSYANIGWKPFVILNDYENAYLDVQQLTQHIEPGWIRALSGRCICCSGIAELRDLVNNTPERIDGITLVEANGTSDACQLMGFLGVGLNDRFLPPIQISVVDVKNWQQRGEYNELEANQVQLSSLIVLTHVAGISEQRQVLVVKQLKAVNPCATILTIDELNVSALAELSPSSNIADKIEHQKTHWSSCSIDLPSLPDSTCIKDLCDCLPKSILRVKGCTKVGDEKGYTYFERCPDGDVSIRPYNGIPVTGSKVLIVGLGSDPTLLKKAIATSLAMSESRCE